MLSKRVVACLDVKNGELSKGRQCWDMRVGISNGGGRVGCGVGEVKT